MTEQMQALGIGRLFNSIRDGVVVADASSGTITLWNERAAELFGYAVDEIVGRSVELLIPERMLELHRAGMRGFNQTGTGPYVDSGSPVELPALHKDGTEFVIELTLSSLDAGARYALAIIRDISDRKRADIELRETVTRLQAIQDDEQRYLDLATHDLKSPLASLIGFAEMLTNGWESFDDAQRRHFLDRILASANRMRDLATDLLDTSYIQSGRFALELADVDLVALTKRVIRQLPPELGSRRVELSAGGSVPCARADANRVEQILWNLLTNALKYSPADSPVRCDINPGDLEVQTCIADDGPGIPDDQHDRIFSKYGRLERDTSIPGTGLGLFITKSLVEAHGGRIWFTTQPSVGATFCFALPSST
ncbi:MAG: ATP-binding protein [Actinomycetota bacterium]